ncbi:MAG: hypothetical protein ACI4RA_08210, partial [Kiritimatiellia bacterium]
MKARLLVGLLALTAGICMAEECWWVGQASSDPMNAGFWWSTGGGLPDETDTICINDGADHPLAITSETDLTCARFLLGVDKPNKNNSVVMSGGKVTILEDLSIGRLASSGGTFTQNGGALTVGDRVMIAFGADSAGRVHARGRRDAERRRPH